MALKQAKVITVTSVKGGVGKTTTLLCLAGILSQRKKKTLLLDFDLYSGSLALSLNVDNEKDVYTLVNDFSNNRFTYLEDYVVKYNDFIDVIPSVKDPRYASKISSKYIGLILSKAMMRYDVILIDTNHVLDEMNLMIRDHSDTILYLMQNTPSDVKNMKTMISIHKDIEMDHYKIILNEAIHKKNTCFSKTDISNIIKSEIDYVIPESFYLKNIDKMIMDGVIPTLDTSVLKNYPKIVELYQKMLEELVPEKWR